MQNNKGFFKDGEANQWFKRNRKTLELSGTEEIITLLTAWLHPFKAELFDVLEIGCGSGHRLKQISQTLKADGYGVEPSSEAVDYIKNSFPSLEAKVGFGDDVPYKNKFDLVHLGFFLYLVDREASTLRQTSDTKEQVNKRTEERVWIKHVLRLTMCNK